jgi:Right handed beta helix region
MNKFRFTIKLVAIAIFMFAFASMAQAQATRTWVSGVGDDVNPCSRTAPCKTYAGAISKTAAGGEISTLDPGGFGAVTITKSIVIEGTTGAGFGSILASGVNGVNVNDSATGTPNTIVVRLRNLSINGAGTTLGLNGVNFTSGSAVHVENCRIYNFSGDGIRLSSNTASRLIVSDTIVSQTGDGMEIAGTPASKHAVVVDRSSFTRNSNGINVSGRADVSVSNSVISINNATGSSAAVIVQTAAGGTAVVDLENCQMNNNSVGVQPNAQSAIRLSNCHMTANGNALNFNGGTIASYGNNRIFGNAAGENFASLAPVQQR